MFASQIQDSYKVTIDMQQTLELLLLQFKIIVITALFGSFT